jgi:hypothetical protein
MKPFSQEHLRIVLIAVMAWAGWIFADRFFDIRVWNQSRERREAKRAAEFERVYGGAEVRILQFYSSDGNLIEGDHATICYGVVNAKSVRMEPHVDGVSPALNRCVEVAPENNTRYTLIAEGDDGRMVTESFTIQVKPDPATLPKISSFKAALHQMDRGRPVYLVSFAVQNAEEVSIESRAFPPLHRAPNGTFYAMPKTTTTYTLTVSDKKGRTAQKQLTLEGPAH